MTSLSTGTDDLGRPVPGTTAALRLLLKNPGVDVESARKWLRDALACLEEPLDGCSVGNAENQASKALVALGRPDAWRAHGLRHEPWTFENRDDPYVGISQHSQDCLDNMFRFHASTGGDADCICGGKH